MKIIVYLLVLVLPGMTWANTTFNCNLKERIKTPDLVNTDFSVQLDSQNNFDQLIEGKLSTSRLTVNSGAASWKILSVVAQAQFDFTMDPGAQVSFQFNPPGDQGNSVLDFNCPSVEAAPQDHPAGLHCSFQETSAQQTSAQNFDVPYTGGDHDVVYLPKAKYLPVFGVVQVWGGVINTVMTSTSSDYTGVSAMGPWTHPTTLGWSPVLNSRATVSCTPF